MVYDTITKMTSKTNNDLITKVNNNSRNTFDIMLCTKNNYKEKKIRV